MKPRRRTKRRRTNPHDRNETGTNEKEHNRKEANNKVNTQHIGMTRCSTKYDARQDYMKLLMARDDAYKNNTSKQV